MIIRRVQAYDLAQIAMLEQACFADPWSLESLVSALANELCVFFVATNGQEVAGYCGMHHIIDEGHILNLAVNVFYRRQGVARALLGELIGYAQQHSFALLTLEVRASNAPAIALYSAAGFERVGLRKGYYKHPPEDAVLMSRGF